MVTTVSPGTSGMRTNGPRSRLVPSTPRMGKPSEVIVSLQPGPLLDEGLGLFGDGVGVGLQHRSRRPVEQFQEFGLPEQFGEFRRPELAKRNAVGSGLLLDGPDVIHGPGAQHPGPVGGSEDGTVECGDDIVAGVATADLADAEGGDLLRCDHLHHPEGGHHLELTLGEDAVLSGVDDGQLQIDASLEPVRCRVASPASHRASRSGLRSTGRSRRVSVMVR